MAGKNLGEEGFREAGDALIKALQYDGEQRRVLYLEELCLKSNKLNASCLPALADIVRLAAYDLRDLDLSENDFTITSRQDADAWQDILESFGQCCMLRRVDFSGNALGPKAFEVLARVYSREPEIDQLPDDDVDIVFHDATPSRTSISGDTEALGRQARKMSLGSAQEMYTDDDEPRSVAGSKAVHGIRHGWSTPSSCRWQG